LVLARPQASTVPSLAGLLLVGAAQLNPVARVPEHRVKVVDAASVVVQDRASHRADDDRPAVLLVHVHRVLGDTRRRLQLPGVGLRALQLRRHTAPFGPVDGRSGSWGRWKHSPPRCSGWAPATTRGGNPSPRASRLPGRAWLSGRRGERDAEPDGDHMADVRQQADTRAVPRPSRAPPRASRSRARESGRRALVASDGGRVEAGGDSMVEPRIRRSGAHSGSSGCR
jgi:hypothetical protein